MQSDQNSTEFNIGADAEQVYKIVKDAFNDLNESYSAVRKSALEMIAARPFYALASAAVIGLAAGIAFRNQIAAAKSDLSTRDIAKH